MGNKNLLMVISLVFFILFVCVVSVVAYVFIGGGYLPGVGEPGQKWECNVGVKEKLIGTDTYIDTISCENTGKACTRLNAFLFISEGTLEMWDDLGKISSKSWETGLFSGKDFVNIEGCVKSGSPKIRLYDDDHNLLDEREG